MSDSNSSDSDFQKLLARLVEQSLAGKVPDLEQASAGDPHLRKRLEEGLSQALHLLPAQDFPSMPKFIGAYRVLKKLGQGGMGTVFLGRHDTLEREVAIKVLPRPYCYLKENQERFQREGKALAKVQHPAVAQIHEVGRVDDAPFVAMEYFPEGNLENLLQKLRGLDLLSARKEGERLLPGQGGYEHRVAQLLATVADGLEEIHRAGMIHRDVKPSNVVLREDGSGVLIDFGLVLSDQFGTLTESCAILGTRQYLAPERTRQSDQASAASDIFSLGVSLYQLLTLEFPFSGDSEQQLFRQIREKLPKSPQSLNRSVSPAMAAVCAKALEKDPNKRYVSAADFARDLRAAVQGRPLLAPMGWSPQRWLRSGWFYRKPIAAAAVGLILVSSLAVAFLLSMDARRAANHKRFLQTLQQSFILLTSDHLYLDEERRQAIYQQMDRSLRFCTQMEPTQKEPYLLLAEAAIRAKDWENVATWLDRLEQLGASGYYFEHLQEKFQERDPFAKADDPLPDLDQWYLPYKEESAMDRIHRAHVLKGMGRNREAYHLLVDPVSIEHEFLMPEHLLALCIQSDLLEVSLPGGPTSLFGKPVDSFQHALRYFDRLLEGELLQTQPLAREAVAYNRALLISGAVGHHLLHEDVKEQLVSEAISVLEEQLHLEPWLATRTNLLKCNMYLGRTQRMKELLDSYREQEFAGFEAADVDTLVKALVVVGRWQQAWEYLPKLKLDGTIFTKTTGKMHYLFVLHESLARRDFMVLDREKFRDFFLRNRQSLEDEDVLGTVNHIGRRWHQNEQTWLKDIPLPDPPETSPLEPAEASAKPENE
ncbi:MAG: serine/threonine protein kinase [Planctomycetota bacterium]|nr:MAG: serine/threonine protein kinase [Planctomycetota bacterium]